MKRSVFLMKVCILCSFFCAHNGTSQIFSIGYRSHFGGMNAYKDVMTFYNDNRPWLDKELSGSAFMQGFEIGFGGSRQKYGYSFLKFYGQYSKTRAKGSFNNQTYHRIVRNRMYGIEVFDCWFTPLHIKNVNIGGGVMPLGLGVFRTRTYFKGEKPENIPLSDNYNDNLSSILFNSFHAYINIHLDVSYLDKNDNSIQAQLFYSFGPPQEYDLFYLNRILNPETYEQFNQRTLMKINNAGLKLSYSF